MLTTYALKGLIKIHWFLEYEVEEYLSLYLRPTVKITINNWEMNSHSTNISDAFTTKSPLSAF